MAKLHVVSPEFWRRSATAFIGQLVRVHYDESLVPDRIPGGLMLEATIDAELKRVDPTGIVVKPVSERYPDHTIAIEFTQLRSLEAL